MFVSSIWALQQKPILCECVKVFPLFFLQVIDARTITFIRFYHMNLYSFLISYVFCVYCNENDDAKSKICLLNNYSNGLWLKFNEFMINFKYPQPVERKNKY